MAGHALTTILLPLVLLAVQASSTPTKPLPFLLTTRTALTADSPANIHVGIHPTHSLTSFTSGESSTLDITYGPCDSAHPRDAHHVVGTTRPSVREKRVVWLIPEAVGGGEGCLSAWEKRDAGSGEVRLVGRSARLSVAGSRQALRKRGIVMGEETGIETHGPWFDGVQYLQGKQLTEVEVEDAKNKRIGIVGGGMAGLMTGLLLDSVGLKNWHIIEAQKRIGGRVRTAHFGKPDDYQYQEMGPMRIPESYTPSGSNITYPVNDMKLLFDLAGKLNTLNNNDPKLAVNFIPWYQRSTNNNNLQYTGGIRLPDGTVPTVGDVARNSSLRYSVTHEEEIAAQLASANKAVAEALGTADFMGEIAENMYRAHKKFVDEGWEDFSEFAFIHNVLNHTLNVTSLAGGSAAHSFWNSLFEGSYFRSTSWKTIDHGMQRLPDAFAPLLRKRISYGQSITKTTFNASTSTVTLTTKTSYKDKKPKQHEFDYAVISAPFSVVRGWRISPQLPSLIGRAVSQMKYASACKIALHFKTRFWERLSKPIYGGCDSSDLPIIGSWCYPSYNLNGTGPGVLLASYNTGNAADYTLGLREEEHTEYILELMREVYGEKVVQKEYTGKWDRQCWKLDEFAKGAWADPDVGQHALWIPEYFKTVNNMVFIGEHTSYTHAWIASALESSIRGTVQLLLDIGLVDEAKAITNEWMARWIKV